VVVPLSSSLAPSAVRVEVAPMVGIDRPSRAVCRAVRSVVSARFVRRIGSATMERMEQALALILGLELRSKPG
jgi:mRNA interferase MazF